VIGEFEIGGILHDRPHALWESTKDQAGISKKRFMEYFTRKNRGYAIRVKSAKMYDAPLSLDSFMVLSPPQSFLYL
jgi:predicted transcriptional regulator